MLKVLEASDTQLNLIVWRIYEKGDHTPQTQAGCPRRGNC